MGKYLKMYKKILRMLHSALIWKMMCLRFRIDYKKVVVVLVNENKKLDYYAMAHLKDYMQRKYAEEALVLFNDKKVYKMVKGMGLDVRVKLYQYPAKRIERLFEYYSFYKFFDNIIFTYTTRPKDNQLERALKETPINEEDAVCLGLYRLRSVPALTGGTQRERHV